MTHTDGDTLLEARDVAVRFGGLTALDSVRVTVPAGCLVGLVGPNGAGKTTLFAVCSGLLKPADGQVFFLGRDVTNASPQVRSRLGLARTFQQPEIFQGLTVRQHFSLAYRVRHHRSRLCKDMFTTRGWRPVEPGERDRIEQLLELLSLENVADISVDTLPLGTTRLVEVGRALASNPKVLLLDEPMSGLDFNESRNLARVLKRTVIEEGTSLLLVEHDVAMVLSLCSMIFVLDFGRLIARGTPETIRSDQAVKLAYLGDSPIEADALDTTRYAR